jgi:Domain of unknown function (DUF4440)
MVPGTTAGRGWCRVKAARRKERAMQRAAQRWAVGAVVAGGLIAILADLRAQPAPVEDAQLLAADGALGDAMRGGDKAAARRLLSLQFSFVDANGKIHGRKDFLADLKAVAPAPASDAKAKVYGLVAIVTGHRKSADGGDVFFLDVWAKQKRTWRALIMQDVALAAADAPPAAAAVQQADAKPSECKNPCLAIPYRVRSPAEQDIINSFQALEKAVIAHDADEWSKHAADEFVLYGSGRLPIPKSGRIATIKRQRDSNTAVTVGEVESMRLAAYGDGAAMIATHVMPDNSRPPYRAARVWVKRNGQWQMAISVQTNVK